MTGQNPIAKQPHLALPTGVLMSGQVLAGLAAAILWIFGVIEGGFGTTVLLEGLLEIALVVLIALGTILVLRPWIVRPAMSWAIMFITASLARLVVTAGLSLLLYSAARMAPKALLVSGFVAFMASLIVEAYLTARYLRRVSPDQTTADV